MINTLVLIHCNLLYKKPNSKKTSPTDRALHHYDEFYGSVFGDRWKEMRKALLLKQQYVALVNNYGDTEETVEKLKSLGESVYI